MKAKWAILAKVQLTGFFGFNKLKYTEDARAKKRATGAFIGIGVAWLVILCYVVFISVAFVQQGVTRALPAFMIAAASLLMFIFSLFRGCAMLFAAKDYDAVMCLPVSKSAVIVSRLICSYLINLAFALAVVLPSSIVYFASAPFSAGMPFVILAATLFSPLLPLAVATALGTLITAATAKLKAKGILQSIFAIIALVGIMAASFAISFNTADTAPDMNAIAAFMTGKIYPPALFVQFAADGSVWAIFAFMGISAAAIALLVLLTAPFYAKINTRLAAKNTGGTFKKEHLRRTSVFGALVKKEFKRLFSSAAYSVNSLCGAAFLLLAAVAFLIFDPLAMLSASTGGELPVAMLLYPCGSIALMFVGLTFPSGSALSLEGKSRWIMCSLPLPASTVLLAKALPGFILSAPFAVFFSAVVCAQTGASAQAWGSLLLAPVAYAALVSLLGIWLNYKFPKYDWTNETAAVKNSIPVMILSLCGLIPEMAIMVACFFIGKYGFILFFAVAAASVLSCILLWTCAIRKARLFDSATLSSDKKALPLSR